MNFKELKDFCSKLSESELQSEVIIWREDINDVIFNITPIRLEEDYYVLKENPEDGCFPVSESKGLDPFTKIKRAYKKGHPILCENF